MTELAVSLGWSRREPLERLSELVKESERRGVAAVSVIDSQIAMRDAVVLLSVLARETSSIRLGTGVTNLITRHESVVANTFATLEAVAPGRVFIGLGAGDSAVYAIGSSPQKLAELRKGVTNLRALLAGGEVTHSTGTFHLAGLPEQRIPILLAASQPRMLRLAGAVGDGVILMGPSQPDMLKTQIDHVEAGTLDAGRERGSVFRDLWVTMAVDGERPGVDVVRSWASAQARWLSKWESIPESLKPFEEEATRAAAAYDFEGHLSVTAPHADVISDSFATALAIAGSPEECAARLTDLVAVGVDRVTVSLLPGGRERRLEELLEVWGRVQKVISGDLGGHRP